MKICAQISNVVKVILRYYKLKVIITIESITNFLKFKYKKMLSFLEKNNHKNCIYKDLTPKESMETNKLYVEALDWALSNNNILNIALTGPYGSGKSSVLKTYEENRSHYHYLNLSLATFHSFQDTNNIIGEISNIEPLDEDEIEKRILQQLFYKVKSSRIPFGRFRKINHIKSFTVLKGMVLVFSIVALIIFLFAPQFCIGFGTAIANKYIELSIPRSVIVLGYILLIILFSKLIISFSKIIIKSVKLSKFKVKDIEFKTDAEKDNSIFNMYLDEILYFFEVNPYKIIFIEDLDRFNNVEIFMKLRELNSLINNSDQINRKIVFIYAIKDDMFVNKDRTKFFDYILPVIPIISSTNSGEKLWEELVKYNLSEGLTESFVNDICLYIDDMRILNNIFNEYIIYKNKLMSVEETFLNTQRMFSMIVYKNIYPSDFAKIQYDKGVVYEVFKQKNEAINNRIAKLKDESKLLEKQLNDADREFLQSEKEIKIIYWNEAVGYTANAFRITCNGNSYDYSTVLQNGFDISTIKNNFSYSFYSNYNTLSNNSTMDAKTRDVLISRLNNIKKKSSEFQKKTLNRIEQIEELVTHMKSWSLQMCIEEFGVDYFFPNRNSENGLLVFLLRNGHIDEMYPHYINYFYEGSLTYYDMIFIMKIKDQVALDFTHRLTNIQKVLTRLNKDEFNGKQVLNYDLMNYLLDNNEYKEQFNSVIKQLSDENPVSFSFIDTFLDFVNNKQKFILELCRSWTNIWIYISNNISFSKAKKEKYLHCILIYTEIEDIKNINIDNCIVTYLTIMPNFLNFVSNENMKTFMKIIEEFDIRFTNLIINEQSNLELLDYIIDNNFYELNYNMVKLVALHKSDIEEGSLIKSHLTTIMTMNYKHLWEYIQENISEYIINVFFAIEKNTDESEDIVIYLLKEESISIDAKETIVIKESVLISDITSIPEMLWLHVVEEFKMKCTWNNVINVYSKSSNLVKELAAFLNKQSNYMLLSKTVMPTNNECHKSLALDIICSTELTSDAFCLIYKGLPHKYNKFPIEKLSTERLMDSIKFGLLIFTKFNYDNIRVNHKLILAYFVSENIKSFFSDLSNYEVDSEDVFNFISFADIQVSKKLKIIELFCTVISCDSVEYANVLCDTIFASKQPIALLENVLRDMLNQDISQDNKIKLLLNQKAYLNFDYIKDYLDLVNDPYNQFMILKRRPIVHSTRLSQELVELLKEKDLISSFNEEKHGKIRVIAKYQ